MRPRTKSPNERSKRHIRKERHRQPDVRRTEKNSVNQTITRKQKDRKTEERESLPDNTNLFFLS